MRSKWTMIKLISHKNTSKAVIYLEKNLRLTTKYSRMTGGEPAIILVSVRDEGVSLANADRDTPQPNALTHNTDRNSFYALKLTLIRPGQNFVLRAAH